MASSENIFIPDIGLELWLDANKNKELCLEKAMIRSYAIENKIDILTKKGRINYGDY